MKENNYCGHSGCHTLFPELVVTVHWRIIRCMRHTLYRDIGRRFLLPVGIRFMD